MSSYLAKGLLLLYVNSFAEQRGHIAEVDAKASGQIDHLFQFIAQNTLYELFFIKCRFFAAALLHREMRRI